MRILVEKKTKNMPNAQNWLYTVSQKKPGTHIMANNFHKNRQISMSFDRIVRATLLDNLP